MDEAAFMQLVREHRGEWDGEAAKLVRLYLDSIDEDPAILRAALRQQPPAYDLVPCVSTRRGSDLTFSGLMMTPGNAFYPVLLPDEILHQVVPAGAMHCIGHVESVLGGWRGFHYLLPREPVEREPGTQEEAVLAVFRAHFESL